VKTWMCSMHFWLGATALSSATWAYVGNDRSMYVLAATCASLVIAMRWIDSQAGPAPTPNPPPMEVVGGQMRYRPRGT
jgi:hypothetical protein